MAAAGVVHYVRCEFGLVHEETAFFTCGMRAMSGTSVRYTYKRARPITCFACLVASDVFLADPRTYGR